MIYWGSGGIAPRILDLGNRWRWVVSFTPRPLYLQGKSPGTRWLGDWVGPRAVLDAVVKRKIPSPHLEMNPRTPIVQPVAQRYTDRAITARQETSVWAVTEVRPSGWDLGPSCSYLYADCCGDKTPNKELIWSAFLLCHSGSEHEMRCEVLTMHP
jgi:hypothetical protein